MQLLRLLTLGTLIFTTACSTPRSAVDADKEEWVDLFNGRDLSGWTIKISGYPTGENAFNTFRVEDGLIKMRYDEYDSFNGEFGHLITDQTFSHYKLQVEYRFVGEQVNGGPGWAFRNNGVMYHSDTAEEMALDQDFPTSFEYQLLGGDGENSRTTANLCTPGTQIVMDGELRQEHCIVSNSGTYHGDRWVTAELVVHGSELAQHIMDGDIVMEYTDLQLEDGTPRDSGAIALQAETHPADFRSIRLLNLKGCMDEAASNYKSYLVKHDPQACQY